MNLDYRNIKAWIYFMFYQIFLLSQFSFRLGLRVLVRIDSCTQSELRWEYIGRVHFSLHNVIYGYSVGKLCWNMYNNNKVFYGTTTPSFPHHHNQKPIVSKSVCPGYFLLKQPSFLFPFLFFFSILLCTALTILCHFL